MGNSYKLAYHFFHFLDVYDRFIFHNMFFMARVEVIFLPSPKQGSWAVLALVFAEKGMHFCASMCVLLTVILSSLTSNLQADQAAACLEERVGYKF